MTEKRPPLPAAVMDVLDQVWGTRALVALKGDAEERTLRQQQGLRAMYDWFSQWYTETHGDTYVPGIFRTKAPPQSGGPAASSAYGGTSVASFGGE